MAAEQSGVPYDGHREETEKELATRAINFYGHTTVNLALGEFDMLVLSRHKNERILIGDDIVVTVVRVAGDKVRLGIDAPKEMRVDREEVRRRIEAENETIPVPTMPTGSAPEVRAIA